MTEDVRFAGWLASHRTEIGRGASSEHVDVDTLTRHATGQLSPAKARAVTEHLLVCDDGRCVAFVRAQASDADAAKELLYPAPSSETGLRVRTFQCRDVLWEMFVAAAKAMQVPIDDLLNEAMLQYARARGRPEPRDYRDAASDLAVTQEAEARFRSLGAQMAASREEDELSESEPSTRNRPSVSPPTLRAPLPTPEAFPRAPSVRLPAPGQRALAPPPSRARAKAPPPMAAMQTPMTPMVPPGASIGTMSLAKRLVLTFEGKTYDVDKEHFVIGRSKAQSDLRIDDPNVSRQHAAIERIGSIYYLVDLGSTNGVFVRDDKVTRRALADGDVILITTHRIVCALA